ncbi:UDP-Glycosyltransferase/glycogen phosphorylase [Pseudovirgaria hyperparasitica]|uniref:GDP-Man:Man(3)GlcNAc(2)-PP-Dol alpha-1,2-mannosyltransferase n=1 Tax=Pseudovirgaria hyperparasitica TaxID=470096 RepID=A0A6A6WCM9_9PEZI|nr:UDP-Glycosyltransferase/glycogen phosphorylase [Pseudovirgaria hyperparasitica]KAF2759606.1 UDP-Glycosyltransferase/glycogen phosphorylase [Pseudovirgaria hyperparasitica]
MSVFIYLGTSFLLFLASIYLLPSFLVTSARLLGFALIKGSQGRRELLTTRTELDKENQGPSTHSPGSSEQEEWEKAETHDSGRPKHDVKTDKDWEGIIGFFHPFCNAGGGGERVLWAAILATQKRWPGAICVVYTGDHDVDKISMLQRVKERFNLDIYSPTVHFLYLTSRRYVLSSTWPHFTLLGQSVGSLLLAWDAFSLLVPDIFVDTMGYSFALAFSHYCFPNVPTGAYVHYPTISTDMLNNLSKDGQGVNAGTGEGFRGKVKQKYWRLFARLYGWTGGTIDVVMANSTWTKSHLRKLWSPSREAKGMKEEIEAIFPPVAVEELAKQIEVSEVGEAERGPFLLYIAQFRPEKNHQLVLEAFAELVKNSPKTPKGTPRLILIGSVRDGDDASRVYKLRILAHELRIKEQVEFICDASWPQILDWLRRSSVGVNGMWNEHFGIGVVEYQAAGLISVVNNSGGPKLDIVIDIDGKPTGFHASTASEYADGFLKALELPSDQILAMRHRARKSAERFTEGAFARSWITQMEKLVDMQIQRYR